MRYEEKSLHKENVSLCNSFIFPFLFWFGRMATKPPSSQHIEVTRFFITRFVTNNRGIFQSRKGERGVFIINVKVDSLVPCDFDEKMDHFELQADFWSQADLDRIINSAANLARIHELVKTYDPSTQIVIVVWNETWKQINRMVLSIP